MSHLERFSRSAIDENAPQHKVIEWPNKLLASEPRIYCAYNQTRQQFLSTHAELADLSPEFLREHLSLLTPGAAKALWLAPFRGISTSHVDTPIDLVFLDRNNRVLAVVESFPIAQSTSCNWPSGTALALPAQSIASSGTLAGDQLVLCSPQKMKRRFLNLSGMATSDKETEDLPSNPYNIAHYLPATRKEPVRLTSWEEVLRNVSTVSQEFDAAPFANAGPAQEPTPEPIAVAPLPETAIAREGRAVLTDDPPAPQEEICAEIPTAAHGLSFKRRSYRTRFRTKHQFAPHVRRYR